MEKMSCAAEIRAPREKVWQALWNDANYREWAGVFQEGSHAETDGWKEGSKVLFLDGSANGIASVVAANRPPELMVFRHTGLIADGREDHTSEDGREWAGAEERYYLSDADGRTLLRIEADIPGRYRDYFDRTWPGALQRIKALAERA